MTQKRTRLFALQQEKTKLSKKMCQIIIFALAILTIAGIVITGVIYSERQNWEETVIVEENGVKKQSLNFSTPNLVPGESSVCKINIVSRASGGFHFILDYVGLDEGTLNEFVRVTVCCDNWSGEYNLSDLVAGEKVEFDVHCEEGQVKTVVIEYFIPSSVGNEAQGKEASFDLSLSATLI